MLQRERILLALTATSLFAVLNVSSFQCSLSDATRLQRCNYVARGMFAFDPEDEAKKAASPAEEAAPSEPKKMSWKDFKSAAYNAADVLSDVSGGGASSNDIGSGTRAVKSPTTPVSRLNTGTSSIDNDRVFDGYSAMEQNVMSDSSPGQMLMKEYQDKQNTKATSVTGKGQNWKNFKKSVYGTVDAANSLISPKPDTLPNKDQSPAGVTSDTQFKPLVQTKIEKIEEWEKQKIKMERKIKRDQAFYDFKKSVYDFVDDIDNTIEDLSKVPDKISKKADETQKAIQDANTFVTKTIPAKVDNTVNEIVSIPEKVQAKTNEVQQSVEKSVATTRKIVDDVQAIPSKVERSITDTQKKIVDTKDAVESTATNIKESVEETTTNVKVLLGLEKRKPKPPVLPPPPPKTASELGLELAGSVGKGVAGLAWWMTKESATLLFKASAAGAEAIAESIAKNAEKPAQLPEIGKSSSKSPTLAVSQIPFVKQEEKKPEPVEEKPKPVEKKPEPVSPPVASFTSVPPPPPPPSKPVAEPKQPAVVDDPLAAELSAVDLEVEEALRMAEDALKLTEKTEKDEEKLSDIMQTLEEGGKAQEKMQKKVRSMNPLNFFGRRNKDKQ